MDVHLHIPYDVLSGAITGAITTVVIIVGITWLIIGAFKVFSFGMLDSGTFFETTGKPLCIYTPLGTLVGAINGFTGWPWWAVIIELVIGFYLLHLFEKARYSRRWS